MSQTYFQDIELDDVKRQVKDDQQVRRGAGDVDRFLHAESAASRTDRPHGRRGDDRFIRSQSQGHTQNARVGSDTLFEDSKWAPQPREASGR